MPRHVILTWLLLAALFSPLAARADPSRVATARRLFNEGEVHYRKGELQQALARFQQALALVRRSSILLNVAQCQRRLGDNAAALTSYREYLAQWQRERPDQDPPFKTEVHSHIAHLEQLETSKKDSTKSPKKSEEERLSRLITPTPEKDRARPTSPVYTRWWFWTAAGILAGGSLLAVVLASQSDTPDPISGNMPPGLVQLK